MLRTAEMEIIGTGAKEIALNGAKRQPMPNQGHRLLANFAEVRRRKTLHCKIKPPLQNRRQTECIGCLQTLLRCEGGRPKVKGGLGDR